MDTLWIMEMMDAFDEGKQWIVANLHFAEIDQMVRAKEVFLGYLGGLLSAYALSGDEDLLHKAIEVMGALKPAFNNATGLLAYKYNPKVKFNADIKVDNTVQRVRLRIVNGKVVNTTEQVNIDNPKVLVDPVPVVELVNDNSIGFIGFQQPEFIYFANLTGDTRLEERLAKSRMTMSKYERSKGLYMNYLDAATGKINTTYVGLYDETTDFYYNMIRSYIQLGRQDSQLLKMYTDAIDSLVKMQLIKTIGNQLFARKYDTKTQLFRNNMEDSGCVLPGMLALSARELEMINSTKSRIYWELAVNLTETCYHAANKTKTKLLPHKFNDNALNNEGWMT